MTDLEKFVDLYKSFGIECKISLQDFSVNAVYVIRLIHPAHNPEPDDTSCDKFEGYNGHHTDVTFSLKGKFLKQGFWE